MAMDRDSELGGLWLKTSNAGNKFMSGKLTINGELIEVVIFKNTFKQEGERTPDYRVYRSQPRDGAPPPRQEYQAPRQEQQPGPRAHPQQHTSGGGIRRDDYDLDDSIPF
jgi:uncharacterized protein (DUF736 family)